MAKIQDLGSEFEAEIDGGLLDSVVELVESAGSRRPTVSAQSNGLREDVVGHPPGALDDKRKFNSLSHTHPLNTHEVSKSPTPKKIPVSRDRDQHGLYRIHPHRFLGHASEHLVMADLFSLGYSPMPAPEGFPYDVAIDTGDKFVKLQIKTTTGAKEITSTGPAYRFDVVRGSSSKCDERYGYNEINMIALVACDIKQIAYFPYTPEHSKKKFTLYSWTEVRHSKKSTMFIEDYPFELALQQLKESAA